MADNTATTKGRMLGGALKDAREERGVSLRSVAGELGIDPGLLSRIENGKRVPKESEVARILTHLGVNGERYDEIIAMLSGVSATEWHASTLPEQRQQLAALLEFEANADTITEIAPLLIPGLVQTRAYARAVMSGGTLPPDEVTQRVSMRLGRRDVIGDDRDDPARLIALIGEAALRQVIGSRAVMIEQLSYLLKVAARDWVDLRVVPFGSGWHPGLEGAFTLIDPRPSGDTFAIVFLEHRTTGLILHQEKDVAAYREAVDVVLRVAMTSAASTEVIAGIHNEMRTG